MLQPQSSQAQPSQADVQRWIAEAAYYRAEQRGFGPGYETEDWLAAEAEISSRLREGRALNS
ncbi:MAG TPA: DUF2934 domain-containing protein [Burkholderiales bacterium]|nr:DUF2934 domain-containing protein [Burkholderiales bacterium]